MKCLRAKILRESYVRRECQMLVRSWKGVFEYWSTAMRETSPTDIDFLRREVQLAIRH